MAKEILRLSALSKFYTGKQSVVVALNEVNLAFSRGEFVAITGESGSGKSTLSHVLGGILPYENGEMFFAGNPTSHFDSADWERYRRDNISFISQNYGILLGATVMENVVSALLLTGMDKKEAHEAAESLLRRVELWDMHKRRAAKLSSGQKQRLSIARALAKPAPVLIADEPTGNLDSENSAKVIELLAQAAEDRLVILITHEFSEAAPYATRHIILQDGKVVMDAPLQPAHEVAPFERRHASREKVGLYVARLQQRSRPVWSTFLTIFFALTAFAVFAFLGTLIVNLDDTSTRIYNNSIFKNGSKTRVIVATHDGTAFTQEQLQQLADLKYVRRVEPNGYITDSRYGYREGVDYDVVTREEIISDITAIAGGSSAQDVSFVQSIKLRSGAPYMQTVPVLPEGKTFLSAGRLPENMYEVVAVGGKSLLGKQLTVYLDNEKYWPSGYYHTLNVTVVGVTDIGENLYFHEDIARFWMQITLGGTTYTKFIPDPDIPDGNFVASASTIASLQYDYMAYLKRMYKSGRLEAPVLPWRTTFDNINASEQELVADITDTTDSFILESGDNRVESNAMRESKGKYQLTNLGSFRYLDIGYKTENGMIAEEGEEETVFSFLFRSDSLPTVSSYTLYPIGETQPTEEGTLPEGNYLIIGQMTDKDKVVHYYALSARAVEGSYALQMQSTTIEMDINGVPSGYTEDDIWTFTQVQGTIYTISNADRYLVSEAAEWDKEAQFKQITYCWAVDEDFTYVTASDWKKREAEENEGALYSETTLNSYVYVSPADFDKLAWNGGSEQVSMTISDYAYTDRVIASVQALGFAAASPYRLGAVKQNETLAQQREQTLLVCTLALVAIIALQLILLRTLFLTQTESYRLLSNIGLSARMAKRSILWQVLIFCLLGQVLSIAALAVCDHMGVERIVSIVRYLPPVRMVLLIAVHLLISLLAAWLIMRSLRKNVYASTRSDMDLPMDETEGEVQL